MSIELWLVVAIVGFLALSLVSGLALALILARISEQWEALMTDPLAVPLPRPHLAQAEELANEEEALAGPESLIAPNPGWAP